jgi:SH3-like domain-containing protein
VRSDATVTSKVICTIGKDELVEVVKESYEWYQIKLPESAPSFIKKTLVTPIDEKTAKVNGDNVNIRLSPSESAPILGKAGMNEIISILDDKGGWYEIEPITNSFGWVHKKFVNKVADTADNNEAAKMTEAAKEKARVADLKPPQVEGENIVVEGIIRPYGKVIKRLATHKIIAKDNKVFLLKGNKENLDSLNYRKVRITGKLIHPDDRKKTTLIEIQKIEDMD